jgi:hypothetical protein
MVEPSMRRVLILGGTGFLGSRLAAHLKANGQEVTIASRTPLKVQGFPAVGVSEPELVSVCKQSEVVIQLAGATISGGCSRAEIKNSRIKSTRRIVEAINKSGHPTFWIMGSAVGFYGDRGDTELTELDMPGSGFFPEVAVAWEAEAAKCAVPHAILRTGVVLDREYGAFPKLLQLARLGLGGQAGSGSQWVSWIHIADFCRSVQFVLNQRLEGAINLTSPEPATNKRLMQLVRLAAGAKIGLPAPAIAIKIVETLGGPIWEAVLDSTRAVPHRLQESGYEFEYPELSSAITSLKNIP